MRPIKSRLSHFEDLRGSVETMISSKSPPGDRVLHRPERVRAADQALDRAVGLALEQWQRVLQRPVRLPPVADVGDQQGKLAGPGLRAPPDFLEQLRRGRGSVRHDEDPA